ncbi:sigma-70 family RNA polymerase sigma factor [Streptomyces somaliensis DSM 40738]|uniref:Sigma-70 family RNA polymerase sigma factor n=1 Tax=Streptomyces somaliensis (strain ATCC 33201 / DSM 40738 / JCM 12659 / KCTC 9044 / NCTC 11332 / NRRL B-12077 / IP 733) TaxID=1134445 RepID=A0AA44DGQ3_STRE0|nr:sigma-70 family RNA polymerase sigma factor [Streptomyces somaliensis]MCQ0024018.1 sigma-70 family RNA polymerase sigma factor [Streptomyces somaliensis DSM 40738]NKY15965.1 sigma-70 family RNA polymerase sigma factor [Streptomyces somaliensis DSM 40738]
MRGDDGELGADVRLAQEGDERAFARVYRTVHPGLLRRLRRLVGDDAEDVAAEAWLEIARDLGRFRGDGHGFRGWAAAIARHRGLDHLRGRRRRPPAAALGQEALDLPDRHDTASAALESLSTQEVLALVRTLPRDQAGAVLLHVVIGLGGPAAARALGKRPGAVRTAAHRGLRRLAGELERTGPGDPGGEPPGGG